MEPRATGSETERPHPLLWAINDLRDALDTLVEEQKALIAGFAPEPIIADPRPSAAHPPIEPDPTTARKLSPNAARPRTVELPRAQVAEPIEPAAIELARPEAARQRLDALAAKLLDRSLRQTAADTPTRQGEG